MQITYYGQSCFLAEVSGKRLLFDPFITPNKLANHINIYDIFADYIFLSHGHTDHIADAEGRFTDTATLRAIDTQLEEFLNF